MVVGETVAGIGAKAVLGEEAPGGEDFRRIGGALALAFAPQLAQAGLLAAPAPQRVVDLAVERAAHVAGRVEGAGRRDRVDVAPGPAGDAQHLVDREPGNAAARALLARQAFFLDGGNQIVIVQRDRRSVVLARMECQEF